MKTMPRRVRAAALVLPLAIAAASVASTACDLAMHHYSEKQTAEWRKTYELKPGGRIEIKNVNGKIEVQPAAGNTVEVLAEKSASGASVEAAKQALAGIEIQDTASPDEVRIVTKVSRTGGGLFGGGNQMVHYTVKVPASAEAIFSTVNGGVELTGLKGRVTAEATNGGVRARDISGPLDASTTNGGIEVELAAVADSGVKLGCVNGGIELKLPSTAKANISARVSNGGISASGLPIETVGESSTRRLEGRLNGGGPQIELSGTNGGITIASR
jgi:bifunctional DNA-binding transcriptional regulator/antitoxin component of YhaV-PrlF toxin-antitoxin module